MEQRARAKTRGARARRSTGYKSMRYVGREGTESYKMIPDFKNTLLSSVKSIIASSYRAGGAFKVGPMVGPIFESSSSTSRQKQRASGKRYRKLNIFVFNRPAGEGKERILSAVNYWQDQIEVTQQVHVRQSVCLK